MTTMFQHLNDVLDAYPVWLWLALGGVAALSYFLGCFNGAMLVSRYILRDDIREHGSGNAGLTNFLRTFGGGLVVVVILVDALKVVAAILFSCHIFSTLSPDLIPFAKYWAGMFCLIGHMYPCIFQFRGGKGILSGGFMVIMIGLGPNGVLPAWLIPVIVWGGFLVLALTTRYVSLGSCWPGIFLPFSTWLVYREPLLIIMAVIMGVLILWKHRGNIYRLITHTEPKFSLHKKEETAPDKAPAAEALAVVSPAEQLSEAGLPAEEPPAEAPVEAEAPAEEVPEQEAAPEESGEEAPVEELPGPEADANDAGAEVPADESADMPAKKPAPNQPNKNYPGKTSVKKGKSKGKSGKGRK